jgi:hypothetical protein
MITACIDPDDGDRWSPLNIGILLNQLISWEHLNVMFRRFFSWMQPHCFKCDEKVHFVEKLYGLYFLSYYLFQELQKEIEKQSGSIADVLNLCELLLSDSESCKTSINTESITVATEALEKRSV